MAATQNKIYLMTVFKAVSLLYLSRNRKKIEEKILEVKILNARDLSVSRES